MAETRWLTAEEQRAWRAYLAMTRLFFERIERQLQQDAGMPHAYYEILVRLSEAPRRTARMSELAERSLASRSRISHAVARLEELGWVERCAVADDRRGQEARLTEEGFAVLEQAAPGHVEGVRSGLFDPLTAEQVEQLRAISEAVVAHLAPDGLASLGPPGSVEPD